LWTEKTQKILQRSIDCGKLTTIGDTKGGSTVIFGSLAGLIASVCRDEVALMRGILPLCHVVEPP
jgi:hypothetical protein